MDGAATSGAGAGAEAEVVDGAPSGSRSGDRCRSESGFGCVSNDTVPEQYKTFHTKDEIDKLLQKEMNEALSDALIKQIELQRDEAKKAQKR